MAGRQQLPEPGQPRRPSITRRAWRGTRVAVGGAFAPLDVDEIARGANLIARLYKINRAGLSADRKAQALDDGTIDLEATAVDWGITLAALKDRLRVRRRQTALCAYAMFGLGVGLLTLWLYAALHMPMSRSRIVAAVEYLPFCTLFFLLAFKSAWINWQIRTLRLGSAVAYCQTTDPFLPR